MNLQGRNLQQGLRGDDVRLLQSELALLNVVIAEGERLEAFFGPSTADAIKTFQKQHVLPTDGMVDAVTARAINAAVDALHPPSSTVSGRIYSAQRAGLGGLRIVVVDRNAGPDVLLAEGQTTDRGTYTIHYSTAALSALSKTAPDLQVRVLTGTTLLAASDVRYGASPSEALDIVVSDESGTALASEHDTLTGAIGAHFKGNLAELQESATAGQPDQRSDITYLANKTGWDARAVALAALADQFSRRSGPTAAAVPPVFFYALFRAGLPANEDALYRLDSASLTRIWTAAAARGVMPPSAVDQIPRIAGMFQSISAQKLLAGPALAGVSPVGEMLASVSKLSGAQLQQFATLYAANRDNMPAFWTAVQGAFGNDAAASLQLDGKLAFLTINNAALMQAVKGSAGAQPLTDPAQLAGRGFHRADKWKALLPANAAIPPEIPGETPDAKKENYARYLAAQVRLSYPTASVAEMVKGGDLPLLHSDQVTAFLTAHQNRFAIGAQPIQQFVARNPSLQVSPEVVGQIKRIERLYQITPSDTAMSVLLQRGVDSAFHIARQDKDAFVQSLAPALDAGQAAAIYNRSVQVHNAVLNLAVGYITARNGLNLGAGGQLLRPAPAAASAVSGDVIAYPTLEQLFGSMDFCSCDHCRSVLSPAAYLVDLLQFIDKDAPPPNPPDPPKQNPQAVLFARRPDIQHLPLTCENTNTALPYIDIVNEALEYYVASSGPAPSLNGYLGHDTGAAAAEDLMASPRYVIDAAYDILRSQVFFPPPLPFHQPLESLRLHFDKLEVPLPLAMERLRRSDDVERGANAYGWRDILMEELRISREEYRLLTDGSLTLAELYGFAPGGTDEAIIAQLSNVTAFSRRVGVSYDDLLAILKTRFVNPNGDLIPKLEKLGMPFAALKEFHDGTMTDQAFDERLPQGAAGPDPAEYGGDIKAWVKAPANFARIMSILVLAGPAAAAGGCNFGAFELRYSKPASNPPDNRLGAADFVRLLRFIRLWKKIGWTIDQVDAAICALFRSDLAPLSVTDLDTVQKLDTGFVVLLPRLGTVTRVMKTLPLVRDRDLLSLLTCWSDIGTHGEGALYRRLFLNQAIAGHDPAFADDGSGRFPAAANDPLVNHTEAIRAALTLTADELDRITRALGFDGNTKLTLSNLTAIYRRGWLARKLRLSVRELILLSSLTGIDPFAAPDPPAPAMPRFIGFVRAMSARGFRSPAALYLIWNQDLTGKAAPGPAKLDQAARTLRADFAATEDQFRLVEDPGGDVARGRLALVYGQEPADQFFALLDGTVVLNVENYTHAAATLDPAIVAADDRLTYDSFQHRLSHVGLLRAATRDALKAVAGVTAAFQAAVDALFDRSQDVSESFFSRFPELKPAYDVYVASTDPLEMRRAALLAAFSPDLVRRRKRQQALQRAATAASVDVSLAEALLDSGTAPLPLHAAGDSARPGVDDLVAIDTPGLAAQFFFRDTATGSVDAQVAAANLAYSRTSNPLPSNTTPGAAISGIWRGRIEAPEAGYFNIIIDTEIGATVVLTLDGQPQPLLQTGTVWRNSAALQLKAGLLYDVALTVTRITTVLSIKWETPKRAREVIPGRYLYPPSVTPPFRDSYVRFLKVASLASSLGLTAREIVHFANDPGLRIGGDGWLNSLPVTGDAPPAVAASLLKPIEYLLDFAGMKAALSPDDERLLDVLHDPVHATAGPDSLLFAISRWDGPSLSDVVTRFGGSIGGLSDFGFFRRVRDAFDVIQKIGIPAAAAFRATTNAPDSGVVRDVDAALRARYDSASWRDLIQPINDRLRSLQRDALVSHILHRMSGNAETAGIDTADKLFEYFLMDVQMEPCMQTSRLRHALSTVQLFIERCAMNLEPSVSPASINSKRWASIKRYRVWEANRKVFLYPENWLEPELRDDKSAFFKEIESQLLQSDITEDSAASALLTYLSRLEEVAKLEPCGVHYIEPASAPETSPVMHVVARSTGAHRKYFYRRFAYGTWTPWDPIKLDIADAPVVPVVWQDRLLLFWVQLLKKTPDAAKRPAGNRGLTELRTGDVPDDPPVTLQAVLCWSEYYDGKWQAAKTSDIKAPANLHESKLASLLTPDRIRTIIHARDTPLRIDFADTAFFNMSTPVRRVAFLVHNTHSRPVVEDPASPPPAAFHGRRLAGDLIIYFDANDNFTIRRLLTTKGPDHVAEPTHELSNPWTAPFFYQDSHHAFLVTSRQEPVWVRDFPNYGVAVNPNLSLIAETRPLVLPPPPGSGPASWAGGSIDAATLRTLVTEDAYIDKGLPDLSAVTFNGRRIGPTGALNPAKPSR